MGLHRQKPVVPAAWPRDNPLGDFPLHQHRHGPNRGGLDYRVCLERWELHSGETRWEEAVALKNDAFFLLEDIPLLIDLGVHCLKVQGREYPVPLVEDMLRFYRGLIDAYLGHPKGQPFDLTPWAAHLARIEAERNAARSEGTRLLLIEARQPVPAS